MNSIVKENLREAIASTICQFNPEYTAQSEESDTYISGLIDSVERFTNECNEEDPKEEALQSMQPSIDHVAWLKNNKNSK